MNRVFDNGVETRWRGTDWFGWISWRWSSGMRVRFDLPFVSILGHRFKWNVRFRNNVTR